MGIKTVPHPPYSPDLAPSDFAYSLRSEAVVMRELRRWKSLWRRSLTHFHGALQKLLERYNNLMPNPIDSYIKYIYRKKWFSGHIFKRTRTDLFAHSEIRSSIAIKHKQFNLISVICLHTVKSIYIWCVRELFVGNLTFKWELICLRAIKYCYYLHTVNWFQLLLCNTYDSIFTVSCIPIK